MASQNVFSGCEFAIAGYGPTHGLKNLYRYHYACAIRVSGDRRLGLGEGKPDNGFAAIG